MRYMMHYAVIGCLGEEVWRGFRGSEDSSRTLHAVHSILPPCISPEMILQVYGDFDDPDLAKMWLNHAMGPKEILGHRFDFWESIPSTCRYTIPESFRHPTIGICRG